MPQEPSTRRATKHQPKNTTRKSKEERDAIARSADLKEWQRIETAKADVAQEAAQKRGQQGAPTEAQERRRTWQDRSGRGRSKAGQGTRGGFMGAYDLTERRRAIAQANFERQNENVRTTHQEEQRASTEQHAVASKKNRRLSKTSTDANNTPDTPNVKLEPSEYPDSFALDELIGGPRKNIEYINLVSSGESGDESEDRHAEAITVANSPKQAKRQGLDMFPVRLSRREHIDRVAGINAEGGSTAALEMKRSRKDEKSRDRTREASKALKSEARGNNNEDENHSRKWKGVYEDDREEGLSQSGIKTEPTNTLLKRNISMASETEDNPAEVRMPISRDTVGLVSSEAQEEGPENSVRRKEKSRSKAEYRTTTQVHSTLTEEEEREADLHQQELRVLRYELGQADNGFESTPLKSTVHDEKADNIYLFQIPPIIPDLYNHLDQIEADAERKVSMQHPLQEGPAVNITQHNPLKTEDEDLDHYRDSNERMLRSPQLATGKVGKLRVHKSGLVTLSWGGTSMEVKLGTQVSFLQTAVLLEENAGPLPTATSLGNIRGRFVVCPHWNKIMH